MPTCFVDTTGPMSPFRPDTVTVTNPSLGTTSTIPRTDFEKCQWVIYTGTDYAAAQAALQVGSVDPVTAGAYFGFAFASTVSLWAVAHGAGLLIQFIRRN